MMDFSQSKNWLSKQIEYLNKNNLKHETITLVKQGKDIKSRIQENEMLYSWIQDKVNAGWICVGSLKQTAENTFTQLLKCK